MPKFVGTLDKTVRDLMLELAGKGAPRVPQSLRPAPDVILEGAENAFIFPVVGTAGLFRTEAVIINRRNVPQRIAALYWPIGGGAANCSRPARIVELAPNTWYFFTDLVPELFPGQTGFGSVIIIGLTANGEADPSARIDGNARIWNVAEGGGTASQNFPSMSLQVPPGPQIAFGLRSDEFYRTNWGIFNYDTRDRTFDIIFDGLRADSQDARIIPACTLIQDRLTGGPYGSVLIVFIPRDGGGFYYAYGSSVDNVSGDAWSVPARQ